VAVGLGDPPAVGRDVAVAIGDVLDPGLDGLGVSEAGDSEAAELAACAPGAGSARGRIAAPMATAAINDGTMATAMKMVERVWFMGVSPRIARPPAVGYRGIRGRGSAGAGTPAAASP
jgi:hypothetical protein